MQSDQTASVSMKRLWAGRILSGLAVLFFLFDSITKLMRVNAVVQGFVQMGYPRAIRSHNRSYPAGLRDRVPDSAYVDSWRRSADGLSGRSHRQQSPRRGATLHLRPRSALLRRVGLGRTLFA